MNPCWQKIARSGQSLRLIIRASVLQRSRWAKGLINGIDTGAHKGGRFANQHRRLQAISALQAHRT
jgi:hypothetical protein